MSNQDIEWRLKCATDYYFKQHDAMHRIKDRINWLAALLLTPIAAAIYFISSKREGIGANPLLDNIAMGSLCIAALAFLAAAAFVLYLLVQANNYPYPQQPLELGIYYGQLPQDDGRLPKLQEKMLASLETIIKETKNLNDSRNIYILRAQRTSAIAFPFLFIAAAATLAQYTAKPDAVQIVQLKQPITVKLETTNVEARPATLDRTVASCTCNSAPAHCTRGRTPVPPARTPVRSCGADEGKPGQATP